MSEANKKLCLLDLESIPSLVESLKQVLAKCEWIITYQHTNGFLKALLKEYEDGSRLRLHLWQKGILSNPHNHRWDFCSRVASGALEEILFFPDQDNINSKIYTKFQVRKDQLRITQSSDRLLRSQPIKHLQGAQYERCHNAIHQIQATRNGTISIVATGKALGNSSKVWSPIAVAPIQSLHTLEKMSRNNFLKLLREDSS